GAPCPRSGPASSSPPPACSCTPRPAPPSSALARSARRSQPRGRLHTTDRKRGTTMTANTPTIVLVHGAFADSSGFDPIVRRLLAAGYPVLAAPNPLRGIAHDAAQVRALIDSVDGPTVLVGHSYGGAVISAAAAGSTQVTALVYLAAFVPDTGER